MLNLSSPSLYTVAPQYTLYEHVRRFLPELSIVALRGSSHNHLAEHRVRLLTIAHNVSRRIHSINGTPHHLCYLDSSEPQSWDLD